MGVIGKFLRSWRALRRFRKLPRDKKNIVFYSEGGAYLKYLGGIMTELAGKGGHGLCYVTSDPADPMLETAPVGIDVFYIGTGGALITFFQTLGADVLVMSMPDLENFHVKRSVNPVRYVYIHHSLVSSHMIYRTGAFNHFDVIFCAGPHHAEETRQWEQAHELSPKQLVEHGYAPLDELMKLKPDDYTAPVSGDGLNVLIAPSWGPEGLLEIHGEKIVSVLLDAGHTVTVRPHPRTGQLWPQVISSLKKTFSGNPAFSLEVSVPFYDSLLAADVMVSDWSGAALEFAFGLERPVLFVDVPRKVNNPDYKTIAAIPIEVGIREKIGAVLADDDIDAAPDALENLMANRDETAKRICAAREGAVFNIGQSAITATAVLDEMAKAVRP